MSIEEKVKNIIVEQLGVDLESVTPEASFIDDLGADSLDIVELVMTMEACRLCCAELVSSTINKRKRFVNVPKPRMIKHWDCY